MITPDQILSTTGDDLSRLLGEVLQPEHEYLGTYSFCVHCKSSKNEAFGICHHPIPLYDFNIAMKFRDKCVEKWGKVSYFNALIAVYERHATMSDFDMEGFALWLSLDRVPAQILQACAICEIEGANNQVKLDSSKEIEE